MKLKYKNIDKVVLLGGCDLLLEIARWCRSEEIPVLIITSPRHANELIEKGKTLQEILTKENNQWMVATNIEGSKVENFLGDLQNSFCLCVGNAWSFNERVIKNLFKGKLTDLHGTRLPQNRGGAIFSWQIMMGNKLGFCQLHLVNDGENTGDIIKTEEFLYPASCRTPKDYQVLYNQKNLKFVTNFIKKIREQSITINTQPQTEYLSTFFPRLNTDEHGWINWNDDIIQLDRFICAFDEPYAGAKCLWRNETVFIKSVSVDFSDASFHAYQSGIVYRNNKKWLSVCANGGTLIIESITDTNGKSLMEHVKVGDRLLSNSKILDNRNNSIIYTPTGKKAV